MASQETKSTLSDSRWKEIENLKKVRGGTKGLRYCGFITTDSPLSRMVRMWEWKDKETQDGDMTEGSL